MANDRGIESLRPRFMPDPDAQREWGSLGALLARMVRKRFAVPPTAALGLTQVQQWLESLPEYKASATELQTAILATPMPEHWPLSTATLRQLLCGDTDETPEESWPMIFRASVQEDSPEAQALSDRMEGVLVRETSPEKMWSALLQIVASVISEFEQSTEFKRIACPRIGVVIQPHLVAEIQGHCHFNEGTVSWTRGSGELQKRTLAQGGLGTELAPFWELLWKRARAIEKLTGGPTSLRWLWDGAQLWFVGARPDFVAGSPGQRAQARSPLSRFLSAFR